MDGGESMWCAACGAYSVPELAGAGLAELAGADAAALPRSAKVDRVAQIVRAAAAEGEKARPLLETVDRDCSRPLHAVARRHAAAARRSSGSFCIVYFALSPRRGCSSAAASALVQRPPLGQPRSAERRAPSGKQTCGVT